MSISATAPITIGLVINKIPDCDIFMNLVQNVLTDCNPILTARKYYTETVTYADDKLIQRIFTECDAAICAIGHCGSCTAGTVKDAIALIEKGIPAVSLITDLFWSQSEMLTHSLGWPSAPRVRLPYPIWGTEPETMKNAARTAVMEAMVLLTQDRSSEN